MLIERGTKNGKIPVLAKKSFFPNVARPLGGLQTNYCLERSLGEILVAFCFSRVTPTFCKDFQCSLLVQKLKQVFLMNRSLTFS